MKKYFIYLVGQLKRWCERQLNTDNENKFRSLSRIITANRRISFQKEQEDCRHIAGGNALSEQGDTAGRTSIAWHGLNTEEVVGVCTNCQRYFFPSDPDYSLWRSRASFNRYSASGKKTISGVKAEPFLNRLSDPPTSVSVPLPPYKNCSSLDGVDPWLLRPDGSRDPFTRVDFLVPGETIDVDTLEQSQLVQSGVEAW